MWRDRETPSEPSAEEENHNSPSSEGNAGVPDSLQPLLASPRQHASSRASALRTTPFLSLGCLQPCTRFLPAIPLPWMTLSPQPCSMGQEVKGHDLGCAWPAPSPAGTGGMEHLALW